MPDDRELPGSAMDRENWESADPDKVMTPAKLIEIEARSYIVRSDQPKTPNGVPGLVWAYGTLQQENARLLKALKAAKGKHF